MSNENKRAISGAALTFAGVVIALVGAFLAWPMVVAISLGGVSVGQGLGTLACVPVGLALALFGQRFMNKK